MEIVILVIWLIGILPSYLFVIKKWDQSTFNKIFFSILWPTVVCIYPFYYIINKYIYKE